MADCTDSPLYRGRALALTGPGVHRPFPHDPEARGADISLRHRRIELARIPIDQSADIAIVGGGESALSCVAFLRAFRPDAELTIYTPSLPMSRGESFLENRVFSNPDEVAWETLDEQTRRDFVRHCDRGVFDPATLQTIAYDDQCRFVTGRVTHVSRGGRRRRRVRELPRPRRGGCERPPRLRGQLHRVRSAGAAARRCSHRRCERRSRAGSARCGTARRGRRSRSDGTSSWRACGRGCTSPGLGALSQGPGFANLGCLGLLANRVLRAVAGEQDKQVNCSRNPITEVV